MTNTTTNEINIQEMLNKNYYCSYKKLHNKYLLDFNNKSNLFIQQFNNTSSTLNNINKLCKYRISENTITVLVFISSDNKSLEYFTITRNNNNKLCVQDTGRLYKITHCREYLKSTNNLPFLIIQQPIQFLSKKSEEFKIYNNPYSRITLENINNSNNIINSTYCYIKGIGKATRISNIIPYNIPYNTSINTILDKSGYYLPYFQQQLEGKLEEYKRNKVTKTLYDKESVINQKLNIIKLNLNTIHSILDINFKNISVSNNILDNNKTNILLNQYYKNISNFKYYLQEYNSILSNIETLKEISIGKETYIPYYLRDIQDFKTSINNLTQKTYQFIHSLPTT